MNTRRTFFGSLLTFLGLGAVAAVSKTPAPARSKLKGFLVFTVNVGHLPPFKAEAFLERLKGRLMKERHDPDWQIVMLPVRPPQETKFEVIVLDGNETAGKMEARRLKAFDALTDEANVEQVQITPPEEEVKDYILLMLGAPVVKIEMDEQQLKLCFEQAVEEVMESPLIVGASSVKRGALAFAKVMLGRIRCKYLCPPGPNGYAPMDGPSLLAEGERELWNWRQELCDA